MYENPKAVNISSAMHARLEKLRVAREHAGCGAQCPSCGRGGFAGRVTMRSVAEEILELGFAAMAQKEGKIF